MLTIHKFTVPVADRFSLALPEDAEVLSVGFQESSQNVCMWVKLNTVEDKIERVFLVYGTGHPIVQPTDFSHEFIGTVQMSGGQLVWHIFEETL